MSFPHSLSMPELGFTSSMEVYQLPSRHYNIQLRYSKPTSKQHRFRHHGSKGNGANLCELQLWSHNSQVFAHGCSLQMGTMRSRSRKLKVLSFGHGRSSLPNEYKLGRVSLEFCKSKLLRMAKRIFLQLGGSVCSRQRHGRVQLGLDEVNSTNLSFVVRSSSTLSVGKVVEREGGGGKKIYDAIGAKVLVLEKYVIPGGSSGYYERDGYTFDVGSSVMFGFSDKGNLNLITQALAAVGCGMLVIPDPTTVHYHLPDNLYVLVHREYSEFISERTSKFPHEKQGILKFYGVCWKVFNALNSLELKSLEEPIYHFGQFFQKHVECLTLVVFGGPPMVFPSIFCIQCFIVSTVKALQKPMINASMVMCDRHYGGINYPVGGVGGIANQNTFFYFCCLVCNSSFELSFISDRREFFAKTFEEDFRKVYVQAPSFLSIHVEVKAEVLPPETDCHHFVLEYIPTVLDSSLAPEGRHILRIFTTSSIEGLSPKDYEAKKEFEADEICKLNDVGTPKTHRRYLARDKGTYGPIPRNTPKGLLGMPFNTTAMDGLYCVGDSCFPGQGVIAVSFSGVLCAHRVAADIGLEKKSPVLDAALLRLLGWLRTLA
ncbi:unnamed protein product [Malus baccata var. baccata]